MLLIYVEKVTNRLGYTLNLVFGELMGIGITLSLIKGQNFRTANKNYVMRCSFILRIFCFRRP